MKGLHPGRLGWLAACAALAVLATGIALDRTARYRPELAASVPKPLRYFAQEARAADIVGSAADGARALAETRTLLRRRPVPAGNLTLYSIAAAQAGDERASTEAIVLAAGRGWRVPLAQHVVVQGAIAAGEWQAAGDRLYALWSSGEADDFVGATTRDALAREPLRETFARRLASNPEWRDHFLSWGSRNLPSPVLGDTVARALAGGAAFDCARLSDVARAALRAGDAEAATAMWSGPCAAGGVRAGSGNALAFPEAADGAGGDPFGWKLETAGGLRSALRASGGRTLLDYRSTQPSRLTLAQKYLRLAPGSYTLGLTIGSVSGTSGPQLLLGCVGGDEAQRRLLTLAPLASAEASFAVPASGCAVQRLTLRVPRGEGQGLALSLSGPQ